MLDIQLLGDFVLLSDGSAVPGFSSARLRSLLAYLLLRRQARQPRSAVAFSLWPDSTEEQAHASLRSLLHQLRHILPDAGSFLHVDSRTVQWRAGAAFRLDVAEFEAALAHAEEHRREERPDAHILALEEAVDIYRGDLLPTCYDDWIVPERERLSQEMVRTLERLVALLESRSDYEGAVEYAQRLLQHDPLHESTYRLLMRLYMEMGDPARALRVYHTCATVLERELGVEPGPSTRQAYEKVVQAYRPETTDDRRPATDDRRWTKNPQPVVSLVGRREEWARLRGAWQEAIGGKPQMVIVEGEAGIGKTMLAERLADWAARQGYKTAIARCYEAEGDLAYAPVVSWLRAWPLAHLEPVWYSEVARLVPEALPGEVSAAPPAGGEPWQRQRLFEALARATLGSGVSLLVLDDAHWCDADTIEWLHFLLRFNPQASLLVVVTLRPEQLAENQALSELVSDLYRQAKVSRIGLGRLNEADTMALAAQLAGGAEHRLPADLSGALYEETEGNPLFVVEMVRAGLSGAGRAGTLPNSIRVMIEARLSQLSAEALTIARLAATIGRAFEFPVVARAADLAEAEVVKALDELWQRRIVREYGMDGYDFSHDKLREVAYAGLSPARRALLHRRVGEALEWVYRGELESVSGEIGMHFEKGQQIERALPYYARAGDAARAVYANEVAIGYYRKLLPHLPEERRIEVLLKVGRVEQLMGRWPEARASYLRAAEDAQAAGEMNKLAQVEADLGGLCREEADYPRAIEWLEKAHARFVQLGDAQGEGEALGRLGEVFWSQSDYRRALEAFQRCLFIAESRGDRQSIARGLGRLGRVYADLEDYPRALDYIERQLKLAIEIGDQPEVGVAYWGAGNAHWYMADYRQAVVELTQALQTATRAGYRRLANMSVAGVGSIYYDCGEYSNALACYTTYLDASLALGNRIGTSVSLGNLAATLMAQGKFTEADVFCRKAIQMARALNAPYYLHAFLRDAAELYEKQSRPADALPVIEEAMSIVPGLQSQKLECKTLLDAISIRAAAGAIDRATALAELGGMLSAYTSEEQQAGIHYAIWKIDPGAQESRSIAAGLYKSLYAATPTARFKERYAELTGEQLPGAPALPPLPEAVRREAPDIGALLARVDEMLAEFSVAGH